ncbi:MAG: (2Fe-2S)-binding protein [Saprospiraceae bacterium]|nr:(2Fe-2S)-binding protein [Saprospiraceae bacterium]
MPEEIVLSVNGQERVVEEEPSTPLLYVLRNKLDLTGAKFGCGLGQCGSCMVMIDGAASYSCLLPVGRLEGKSITTIEGLVDHEGNLNPVQDAFLQEQAGQCGYCTNGMIIAGVALFHKNKQPNKQEIRTALQGNLCRCGVQARVIKALERVSKNQ